MCIYIYFLHLKTVNLSYLFIWASPDDSVVKNRPANAGNVHSIPESGEGHGNPLQYSCLQNPMDRGALGLQSRYDLQGLNNNNNLFFIYLF